ncbi:MAG: hypothetical protein Q9218_001135 [Villophora microphyllina]
MVGVEVPLAAEDVELATIDRVVDKLCVLEAPTIGKSVEDDSRGDVAEVAAKPFDVMMVENNKTLAQSNPLQGEFVDRDELGEIGEDVPKSVNNADELPTSDNGDKLESGIAGVDIVVEDTVSVEEVLPAECPRLLRRLLDVEDVQPFPRQIVSQKMPLQDVVKEVDMLGPGEFVVRKGVGILGEVVKLREKIGVVVV